MSNIRDHKGITFLEILIALSIIGIVAVLSVPAFNSLAQNYRVSTAATHLYYDLQYARSEAVKRNSTIYVSFSTGDTWCYGVNVGSTCTCSVANSCGLLTTSYTSTQQLSLSATGLSSNAISFEGSHGAASASATITFTAYNQASPLVTTTVARLGNIQQCATGLNGYTAC